jgi:hypothetical protein
MVTLRKLYLPIVSVLILTLASFTGITNTGSPLTVAKTVAKDNQNSRLIHVVLNIRNDNTTSGFAKMEEQFSFTGGQVTFLNLQGGIGSYEAGKIKIIWTNFLQKKDNKYYIQYDVLLPENASYSGKSYIKYIEKDSIKRFDF